jgi:hypothetical protein
MNNPSW